MALHLTEKNYSEFSGNIIFKADSISDHTSYIQNLLDSGKNIISLPNQTYYVTSPLFVTKSNQTIDFQNSKIQFTQNQTVPHTTGAQRTNDVGIINIKNYTDISQKQIIAIDLKNGKLTLTSTTDLVVNDYVRIFIDCGVYSTTTLTPRINVLARIIEINSTTITVDYTCDWDVSAYTSGSVTKIEPQKYVTLKNVTFDDKTPIRNGFISTGSNPYPADDSHYACCGVGIVNGVNVTIENITHVNGLFNTIHSTNSYRCSFKNITTINPRLWSGGEGYSIQNINFHKVHIENVTGYSTRHTIDFTCGGYAICKNVKSYKSKISDLQFHGQYEHDIFIDGFTGVGIDAKYPYLNAGSGTEFGNAIGKVTIENSAFKIITSKHITYIKELKFINSSVTSLRLTNNVTFDNCYVEFEQQAKKGYLKRTNESSKLGLYNCTVEIMTTSEEISQYDQIEIIGGKIITNLPAQVDIFMTLTACNIVTVTGVNKIDVGIKILNDSTLYGDMLLITNINNNNFYCYRYAGIWLLDNTTCRHLTNISNNNFTKSANTTNNTVYSIDLDGVYKNTSNVNLIVQGNNALNTNNNTSLMSNNSNAKCSIIGNIGITDLVK